MTFVSVDEFARRVGLSPGAEGAAAPLISRQEQETLDIISETSLPVSSGCPSAFFSSI